MATVADIITSAIIKKLENGYIPWFKPWNTADPINYISGRPYNGINKLLLDAGQYATFKQITDKGGKIKKGAKSYIIVFYKPLTIADDDDDDEPKVIRMLRYYRVFNIADTTLKPKELDCVKHENYSIENCEKVVIDYTTREGIKLNNSRFSNQAFYRPTADSITLPTLAQFKDSKSYYAAAFHEMGHSTGHKSRLDRLSKKAHFGDSEYSREELIAEITSGMLCNYTGIDTAEIIDNAAAYIGNWLQALKNDKNMILVAAAKAQAAYDYILNGSAV